MRKMVGYKKVIVFLLVCILITIASIAYIKPNKKDTKQDMQAQYYSADSISKAMSQLSKEDCGEAEIIKDVKTSENILSLTFQGLADTETNKQILKLLDKYNRKASFFVPGILAADDTETITAIYSNGHKIESNTLSEKKHMEKCTDLELVKDFCNANSIIHKLVDVTPEAVLCNSTEYSKKLLKAAYVSGNRKVIQSTHYLNFQSFSSYKQVVAYINRLDKGSILTFKMQGALDEEEFLPEDREPSPTVTKATNIDSVKDVDKASNEDQNIDQDENQDIVQSIDEDSDNNDSKSTIKSFTEQERLLLVVEWVLKALSNTNYQTVFVEDLKNHYDEDFDKKFDQLREKNNKAHAKVYKRVTTKNNMVSFIFRGLEDEDELNEILDFLEFNHLKATFFVTANDIVCYPDRINEILDKNQYVANGGMSGKDLTTMDYDEICLEIYKCDLLLMDKFLINSNLFMPAYGKYNNKVLEAASSLGYTVVSYNKIPITNEAATLDHIMDRYKKGYNNGDVICFNIGLHKQLLNVITQIYAFYIHDIYNVCDVETLIHNAGKSNIKSIQSNNIKSKNAKSKDTKSNNMKSKNTKSNHTKNKNITSKNTKSSNTKSIKAKKKTTKSKLIPKRNTKSKSTKSKNSKSKNSKSKKVNHKNSNNKNSKSANINKNPVNTCKTIASVINYDIPGAMIKDSNHQSTILENTGHQSFVMKNTYRNEKIKMLSEGNFVNTSLEKDKNIVSFSAKPKKHTVKKLTTKKPSSAKAKKSYSKKEMKALRKNNNGKKAEIINTVYTTEQALSFTFYGVCNTRVTDDVLDKLDSINAKGTFFVTEKDLINCVKEIQKIVKKGHEIGICLVVPEGTNFYSVCNSILTIQDQVKKLCGIKPTLVRYAYFVNMTDEMLEAISSTGCRVVWQDLALASSKLGVNATLDDVINYSFNSGNITAKRGYILYFRMDYYTNPALVGELILHIAKDRIETITYYDGISNNGTSYAIKTLSSLLGSNKVYAYPLLSDSVLPSVKDAICPGHLNLLDTEEKFDYMKGRYIGNSDATTLTSLPGFNFSDIGKLNQTGRFTNDKVLFLTFDDWGSDKPISQLLYVLNKHNVKATFFVRTSYVQDNPNLLRATAEAGHAVGSHTDKHLSFADPRGADEFDISAEFTSLTDDEVSERKSDLLISYHKLQSIIGDVQINGIPSLTKILRPPTLAMSKEGMEAIFDMGFKYIVSGDYSTHDYAETDPFALANKLVYGIKHDDGHIQALNNGSILVMHMSDDSLNPTQQADVTAHALDIAIPQLKALGYSFARLNDYLTDSRGEIY